MKIVVVILLLTIPLPAAVRFTVMAWDRSILEKSFTYPDGSELKEVRELHTLKRSPSHRWSGDGVCLFSLNGQHPGTVDEPKLPDEQLVRVKFPSGDSEVLVMLIPDDKEPSGVAAKVFDDSTSGFPWGGYRVMNGTGSPLLMKVGPDGPRLLLAKPAMFSPKGERRNIPVAIVAKADPKRLLFSSVWKHRPDQRRIVFVSRAGDARGGVLQMKVVPERRSEYERALARETSG